MIAHKEPPGEKNSFSEKTAIACSRSKPLMLICLKTLRVDLINDSKYLWLDDLIEHNIWIL